MVPVIHILQVMKSENGYTHEMYESLQAVESEMCPSLTEAISAGKPVKALSNPTSIADCLLVPTVSLVILCTICSQGCI